MNREGMSMFRENKASTSVAMDAQKSTGSHVNTGSSLPPSPLSPNKDDNMQVLMSVCWIGGKLGAALYEVESAQLYLVQDTNDARPDFMALVQLLGQANPNDILVSTRADQVLLQLLQSLSVEGGYPQLHLLPSNDFSPELCENRLSSIRLPNEPSRLTGNERQVHLASYIDISNRSMMRALGALLKYLVSNRVTRDLCPGEVPLTVLGINTLTLEGTLYVERDTLLALGVFNEDWHPSVYKQGTKSASKEGLSLFGILNNTHSVLGTRYLRQMLQKPSRDLSVILSRQESVKFLAELGNQDLAQALIASLRRIQNLAPILKRLQARQSKWGDWRGLYESLTNALLIRDISLKLPSAVPIFRRIGEIVQPDLYDVVHLIHNIVDFDETHRLQKFVVKPGVDENLDEKKLQYEGLPNFLEGLARMELADLPDEIQECQSVYIPQIGYLLAVGVPREASGSGLVPESPGLRYMFRSEESVYYKTPRCDELDSTLGDIQVDIANVETRIMTSLSDAILGHTSSILSALPCMGELDALIALALTALNHSWTLPDMLPEGDSSDFEIQDGRHPLQELCVDAFVPNDARSSERCRIHIITSPNSSGKTVFLKQVGLIVFLAHIGSMVPAKRAKIPILDGIFTRVQAGESVSKGISAFMADVHQMSKILRYTSRDSLVLIDEFGKGTLNSDGLALLLSCLEHFIARGLRAPHLFLSTHFYEVWDRLPRENPLISYHTMEHVYSEEEFVCLFQLVDGRARQSFAMRIAESADVPKAITERAEEVRQKLAAFLPVKALRSYEDRLEIQRCHLFVRAFLDMDVNLGSLQERIHRLLGVHRIGQPLLLPPPDTVSSSDLGRRSCAVSEHTEETSSPSADSDSSYSPLKF